MANQRYARPALLITHTRSGGTMLNYALSTHRRISWARGEPLMAGMEWKKAFPGTRDVQILDCITRASFYAVGGCKITYEQLTPEVWEWIGQKKPKLLHLVRENMIRTVVSQMITGRVVAQQLKGHESHSFNKIEQVRVTLSPSTVIAGAMRQEADVIRKREAIRGSGLDYLELTYKEIVGGQVEANRIPDPLARKICDFLGVRFEHLTCDLRRVNSAPLSELIENWAECKKVIAGTKFKDCLED